jgi:FkbM family methyltransferase
MGGAFRRRKPSEADEAPAPPQPAPARGEFPTVLMRVGTSDPDVFMQVFAALEYGPLPGTVQPGLIVDCGANVGYAAVSFLERWPQAEVIAIEPDPGNAALARQNLAPYGARATLVEAGVWSATTPLRIRRGAFGDGRQWSFQVEACPPGETPDVDGVGLADVIGARTVELLKVDIERGELELFGGLCPWLEQVRNIVIELHDDECTTVFHRALELYEYDEFAAGELTFCCNLRRRRA